MKELDRRSLLIGGSALLGVLLTSSACSRTEVVKERPKSRSEVAFGGALAGGEISQDEWDAMVAVTSSAAYKILVKDCNGRALGSGSGFNIGQYVVTNRHVVDEAERITLLSPDDSEIEVERWAMASNDDLALLEPSESLGATKVVLAPVDPVSGDLVASVGFPLGGEKTTRRARILKRLDDQDYSETYALTTTASVQPGDSGGVLVNAQGEVVAVTTAIALKDNVSIGVPVSRVHRLLSTADFRYSSDICG